jgi:hypothetical protein
MLAASKSILVRETSIENERKFHTHTVSPIRSLIPCRDHIDAGEACSEIAIMKRILLVTVSESGIRPVREVTPPDHGRPWQLMATDPQGHRYDVSTTLITNPQCLLPPSRDNSDSS